MYKISKEFSFCYGHRVFTQKLNEDFCANGDTSCKCRHLHGHEGLVTVHLESDTIDTRGMIVDFKELGWLKDFLDNTIDHKFIISQNDPMFSALVSEIISEYSSTKFINVTIPGSDIVVGRVVDLSNIMKDTPSYEVLEGYFIVDFVPTSENLSKWMFDLVSIKMKKLGAKVSCVEWHETPKSCARYYG